jgi:hypothetical protein
MPFTASQILTGMVLPAALLGIIGLLVWRPWKRDAVKDFRWIFGPLTAGAFGIAYWTFEPKPGWPPIGNVVYLLFYFALVAGILSLADAILKPPLWLRAGVLLLAWRLAVRLLLASQVPRNISETSAELWIDFLSAAVLTWWLTFENFAERAPGVTTPLLLAAVAGVSMILLLMDLHIQSSGALAGGLTGLSIAAAVLGFCNSRIAFSRGLAQTVVLILLLVLVHGYFYTDDDLTPGREIRAGILLATPLLAFSGDLAPVRRLRPPLRLAVRAIPVVLALAFVAVWAAREYARADQAAPAMQDE